VLLALAAAVAFSFQGSRGLYETTEGRYAQSALEMIQQGRYLEPTLGGRPHWTKPPLAYWAIAAGIGVAGANGWGVRLSNAFVFCATALLVAAAGAALWDPTTGLVAGLVYVSSLFPAAAAGVVSTDTLLAFWELLAVVLYLRAWRAEEPATERRSIRVMWLVWGLAFMTKGPPALLPLLAIAAFGRLTRRRPPLLDPVGLAAFAVVAFSWYAWVSAQHPGLLRYFVGDEVIGRAFSNEFRRNPQWYKPFVIYLPVLVLGQGVWLLTGARVPFREGLSSPRAIWSRLRRGDAASFLLLWLLLPLAVLWISSSRLPLYVLPLYAPIALAVGRALVRWNGEAAARRALALAVPSALAIVLLKGVAAYAAPRSESDMWPVYSAVRREAGSAAADYRAFDEEKLYGLQFYLGGELRRVSRVPEPWADEALGGAIVDMSRTCGRTHVVVSSARGAPQLEAALSGAGLPHRRVHAGARELFVVAARGDALACGPEAVR
jgi:4-amino-4-deoxy-L-arabinose transferase